MIEERYDVLAAKDGQVTIGINLEELEEPPTMDVVGPHLERLIHEGGTWREYAASGTPREYVSTGDGYDLYLSVHGPTTDAQLAGIAAKFAVAYQGYLNDAATGGG